MKTAPIFRDSFGFFEATKIRLMEESKRLQRVDFDHLTDEKHIWIYINYNGKFGKSINIL
jgi:hypothetical protein